MTAPAPATLPKAYTRTREAGHEAATDPFDNATLTELRDRLWALAFGGQEFSADWFRSHLPVDLREKADRHPQIYGMLFTQAAESGMLVDTGRMVKSAIKSRRGAKITLWKRKDR